jgi:hypothetical protein
MSTTLPPPTPALTTSDAARPGWYRALRIAISLSPLLAVHFALLASPWVDFTWWA